MEFLRVEKADGIAKVILARGKVNAINEFVIDELTACFRELAADDATKAVILTGQGKFFTYGFDIPEFLNYKQEDFLRYLTKFTSFYGDVFLYPKPVIAALNGHTMAGGCMIAIACDYRIMVSGKAKISLNEINFGSSLFAGSVEIIKLWLGQKNAETAVYTGAMYAAEEALQLGLIHQVSTDAELAANARSMAEQYAAKDGVAFRSIKHLLRKPLADEIRRREKDSLLEFVDIWYSEATWEELQGKTIQAYQQRPRPAAAPYEPAAGSTMLRRSLLGQSPLGPLPGLDTYKSIPMAQIVTVAACTVIATVQRLLPAGQPARQWKQSYWKPMNEAW
jgi:3,2-trans-enoyl-CoA isomerase